MNVVDLFQQQQRLSRFFLTQKISFLDFSTNFFFLIRSSYSMKLNQIFLCHLFLIWYGRYSAQSKVFTLIDSFASSL